MKVRCLAFTLSHRRCKKSAGSNGFCSVHCELGTDVEDSDTHTDIAVHVKTSKLSASAAPFCPKSIHKGCELWTEGGCCVCRDERPVAPAYTRYVDGIGDLLIGKRYDGYCPTCKETFRADWKVVDIKLLQKAHATAINRLGIVDPDWQDIMDVWGLLLDACDPAWGVLIEVEMERQLAEQGWEA